MNAAVSGRTTVALVSILCEKFQLNVPWAVSEGILLHENKTAANAIIPTDAVVERILRELFIVEKI